MKNNEDNLLRSKGSILGVGQFKDVLREGRGLQPGENNSVTDKLLEILGEPFKKINLFLFFFSIARQT